MKKLFSLQLVLLLLTTNLSFPETLQAAPHSLPITAGSAFLWDISAQRVIYSKALHTRRPPASTTKIMTALVVLERVPLDRLITIPRWAASIEPSKIYLRPGERYRVRDLLHATLISSANDAAEVLAVAAAGSRTRFVQWMNEKARAIGCKNTRFANASGLPLGNPYSSVYDLALIMKKAKENPFLVDSLSRKYHTIRSTGGRKIHLRNHNRLLWRESRSAVIGKTGYTKRGRHCFVGRIRWGGKEVLVAMLGSRRLWKDLKVLLDYQFGVSLYKAYKNRKIWSTEATRAIQRSLLRAGYSPGPVDGRFGSRTVRAVLQFQKSRGLASDGLVGSRTCKALTGYGLSAAYCG